VWRKVTIQTLLLFLTVLFLIIVLVIGTSLSQDMKRFEFQSLSQATEVCNMQSKTTKWKDAQGVEWSVTTVRASGETLESWCKRHDEAVASVQREHPPI